LRKRKPTREARRLKAPSASARARRGRKENFFKQFVVREVEWRRRVRRKRGEPVPPNVPVKSAGAPSSGPRASSSASLRRGSRTSRSPSFSSGRIQTGSSVSRPPVAVSRADLRAGAGVAIADAPLRGFDAVYSGMTAHERELVLITILGAPRSVEIAAGLVVPSQ
jgi:hypothetical protein